jgi:pyruvate kinase
MDMGTSLKNSLKKYVTERVQMKKNVLLKMLFVLNFSHGNLLREHRTRAELVRSIAERCKRDVGILVDLQGPKIRIGKFAQGPIHTQSR